MNFLNRQIALVSISIFFALPIYGESQESTPESVEKQSETPAKIEQQPSLKLSKQAQEKIDAIKKEAKKKKDHIIQQEENLERFRTTGICIGCDLSGLNLNEAIKHLTKNKISINLKDANLEEVIIIGQDLTKSNFSNANLTNAIVMNCNAQKSNFTGAILKGTNVQGSDFDFAFLNDATINWSTNLKNATIDKVVIVDPTARFKLNSFYNVYNIWNKNKEN